MFGRLAPKVNAKTLRFENYVHSDHPVIPPSVDWDYKFKAWTMAGNDTIGDCTVAAIAHMVMLWTAFTGTMVRPTRDQVVQVYSEITGYNGDPATDNGAAITDVLDYWQRKGIAGHKIDGWVQIDHTNIQQVKQAIYVFGAVNLGFNVPDSAMIQNSQGQDWSVVPNDGGIDGGHSVPVFDFTPANWDCATWGMNQRGTWPFWMKYGDEAYAPLSLDWLYKSGIAPSHLNLAQLRADLKAQAA
jgi:hypothetical protein